MAKLTLFTCDGCDRETTVEGTPKSVASLPEGWATADIRVHDVPAIGNGQRVIFADLCPDCVTDLDEATNPKLWPRERLLRERVPREPMQQQGKSDGTDDDLNGTLTCCGRLPTSVHEERQDPEDANWVVAVKNAPGWHDLRGKLLAGQRYRLLYGGLEGGRTGVVFIEVDGLRAGALASWFVSQNEWKRLEAERQEGLRRESFGGVIGADDRQHPRHRRAAEQLAKMRAEPGGIEEPTAFDRNDPSRLTLLEQVMPYGAFFPPVPFGEVHPHLLDNIAERMSHGAPLSRIRSLIDHAGFEPLRHDGQPEEETDHVDE